MRIKSSDGPVFIHNANDILNSPKRINTSYNSNSSISTLSTTLDRTLNNNENTTEKICDLNVLSNVQNELVRVQWCKSVLAKQRELCNNANNKQKIEKGTRNLWNQPANINNTLAAPIRNNQPAVRSKATSVYSESPDDDDDRLDYEETLSVEISPQDEDQIFIVSDTESMSEEGNSDRISCNRISLQEEDTVDSNDPSVHHLTDMLNYCSRVSSDTDFTDENYDCELDDINNINNNNVEETERYSITQIHAVNQLDSIENFQKVFYDKPVLNIDCENLDQTFYNIETRSDDLNLKDDEYVVDSTIRSPYPKIEVDLNIKTQELSPDTCENNDETSKQITTQNIQEELENINENSDAENSNCYFQLDLEPSWEQAVVREIKEAIEKLTELLIFDSNSQTFHVTPNTEKPFCTLSPSQQEHPIVLEDSTTVHVNEIQENGLVEVGTEPMQEKTEYKETLSTFPKCQSANLTKIQKSKNSSMDSNVSENMDVKTIIYEQMCDSNRQLAEKSCIVQPCNIEAKSKNVVIRRNRDRSQFSGSLIQFPQKDPPLKNVMNRRSVPAAKDKKKITSDYYGNFDVYNIETAMPKINLETIELHLRAAREEERRRRTDREEIRRRLAMGNDEEYISDKPGRKPSLQSRLQSGMNLQICFMNEALSDTDSPTSESESPLPNPKSTKPSKAVKNKTVPPQRPVSLSIAEPFHQIHNKATTEADFFTKQARLQTEARMALAQAKEMARMQMEIEKQKQKKSPITEMVRHSLEKVGIPFPEDKRRLSGQILTEMNVAQLQVIVNDLHTQIETLNENLVKYLMDRDDLHMEQDSMLVDIEDLTRYLGAKEQILKEQSNFTPVSNNNMSPPSPAPPSPLTTLNNTVKPHLHRIASLVKK